MNWIRRQILNATPLTTIIITQPVVGIPSLCQGLNHPAVVRTMPKIAVQVGHWTTVWSASSSVTEIQRNMRIASFTNHSSFSTFGKKLVN